MHVMRLECLGKLPFGTYAEIERACVSLTDIDTTDCDNSLASLQILAQQLHEKDPTKLGAWDPATMAPPLLPAGGESDSEEGESLSPHAPLDDTFQKFSDNNEVQSESSFSCYVCKSSFKTVNEVQLHTFVHHKNTIDASKDNTASVSKRTHDLDIGNDTDDKRLKLADS